MYIYTHTRTPIYTFRRISSHLTIRHVITGSIFGIHTYVHTLTHTYEYTNMCISTHTYTYTHTRIYIHTHMYTHAHTHVYVHTSHQISSHLTIQHVITGSLHKHAHRTHGPKIRVYIYTHTYIHTQTHVYDIHASHQISSHLTIRHVLTGSLHNHAHRTRRPKIQMVIPPPPSLVKRHGLVAVLREFAHDFAGHLSVCKPVCVRF